MGHGIQPHIPPQPGIKFYFLLALLAVAMGLQNVTIRKVGGMNIYTAFVTGTLVKFGEAAAEYLLWVRDRIGHRFPHRWRRIARMSRRNKHARHATLAVVLWVGYLAGAGGAALAMPRLGVISMVIPLMVIVTITVYSGIWPLVDALAEEW